MRYRQLVENSDMSLSSIVEENIDSLPIRLKTHVNIHYDSVTDFIKDVRKLEKLQPDRASHIVELSNVSIVKLSLLIKELPIKVSIEKVDYDSVKNFGNRLVDSNVIVDDKGNLPRYVFRYISKDEFKNIKENGVIEPSSFYGRIHASYKPESQYSAPDGLLIAIQFHVGDNWRLKTTLDDNELYVVTDNPITADKIQIVE